MKSMFRLFALSVSTLLLIGAIGCATPGAGPTQIGDVTVSSESSRYAEIMHVRLYRVDDGLTVQGELRRRGGGRAAIPGHIDLEILRPDGSQLHIDDVSYRRMRARSNSAVFTRHIPEAPAPGSRVRVLHHYGQDHSVREHSHM